MAMILDTNALSAFFDGDKELLEIIASAQSLHLPVIVLGEYRFGLKGSKLRKEREPILLAFAKTCTVLPVLESTTQTYAQIRHQLKKADTPIPENDIWISALALEYSQPVVTRDTHFEKVALIERITR
jgi:predicted nucleic acid-binding protein